jgi:hypothetical protein
VVVRAMFAAALAGALVGCSSGKPKHVEEKPVRDDGAVARDAAAAIVHTGPYRVESGPSSDVQIRVNWQDTPLAARASSGRTPCGTPMPGAVAPTVTWGIPDVVVVVWTDHGKAMTDPAARVVLGHCVFDPRIVIAGATTELASAADKPVTLELTEQGVLEDPDRLAAGATRNVMLPIAGHEVSVPLRAGTLYRLGADASTAGADAWLVAVAQPYAAVTDASGVAILRDVPVGTYPVLAWLPPRAGQGGKVARGEVTVEAGTLAEVTLDLGGQAVAPAPPPVPAAAP